MSEQGSVGDAWGDAISGKRVFELIELARSQLEWAAQPAATRGDSLFENMKLTGADVFWLARRYPFDDFNAVPSLHLETLYVNTGAHGSVA